MIPRTSNGCLSPILVVKTIVFFSFISCLSMVVAQNVRFFVEGQPPEPYGDFGYIRGLRIDLNNPRISIRTTRYFSQRMEKHSLNIVPTSHESLIFRKV